MGKGTCHQARQPKLDLKDPPNKRGEPISANCLASTLGPENIKNVITKIKLTKLF